MNPTLAAYLGFVVAALILIWAVIEINQRFTRRKKIDARDLGNQGNWIKLDSTRINASEELLPTDVRDVSNATDATDASEDNDEGGKDDIPEPNLHTRAQQNGHYSESKKPL